MLKDFIQKEGIKLASWLENKETTFHHYYSSIDLRENSYKATPVDINLFPSGFNNVAINLLKDSFLATLPPAKKIGLLIENFTRNEKYLANVDSLRNALIMAGREVSLLRIEEGQIISADGINLASLDLILLNNDLSQEPPQELFGLPCLPNPLFGWYKRKKSCHLKIYNDLVEEMAGDLNFDPWLLTSYLDQASGIDFRHKVGLEELAEKAEKLLKKIQNKYQEYQINEKPYLFIKADSGTFGLGIFVIKSPEEILTINKKKRHSIANIKGGKTNDSLILQEGITSELQEEGQPAERVLYQVKDYSLGSLVRYNNQKNNRENLNSPGMSIKYLGEKRRLDQIVMKLSNLALEREFDLLSNKSS